MKSVTHIAGRRLGLFLVLCLAAAVLAACGGNKSLRGNGEGTPPAVEGNGSGDQGSGIRGRDIDVRGLEGIPSGDRAMFTDPDNPLSTRIIYFGFDTSSIPERFSPVIQAHAKYLSKHPNVHLRLEGHTDPRGTREYNVALGERRADSVKQAMIFSGASRDQVTTLSFGEERPAGSGDSKDAYAKDRRVELVYVK